MKAITIRLKEDVWKACVHRMIDESATWQHLVEPLLIEYAKGAKLGVIEAPAEDQKSAPTDRP